MRTELVAVACTASDGSPDIALYTIECTQEEYTGGTHYDKAIDMARDEGYDGPFKCFDNSEHEAILFAARKINDFNQD